MIISQYRRKIFEKNGLIIKPVILFKSKTIAASKDAYKEIIDGIRKLRKTDIVAIEKSGEETLVKCMNYFDKNGIEIENLIEELKNDFAEEKCIEINSKEESEEKQIAVNTLEDNENEYRLIFAVDMLNEGWDVLNLYDIVRLYNTRDSDNGKPGKTTISEAQLIGRGARYCPFKVNKEQSLYQRKYDKEIDNELRVCEELYYHSAYNPKYIQELNTALQEIGIKAKESREINLQLKGVFKETKYYREGLIFLNEQVKRDRTNIMTLPNTITNQTYHISMHTGAVQSTTIFETDKSKIMTVEHYFVCGRNYLVNCGRLWHL